ncbi:spore coat protein CotH [Runella sp. CRIBMP]|uniref:CotH kinase family protein n=1 Tax=Runella sp. CRIBMP TaxID=2683261 RepID=UPI00141318CD|nr:CotH kinase family protein [Runella sp. CRIBMP]NBB20951.1 spore coat protein CotH [Runella sp. CRIBMP]
MKHFLLGMFFFLHVTSLCAQVKINEVMASNQNTVTDNADEYSDWIELYNPSGSPVDLAGYYMTDTYSNLTKFRFTTTPGQVVVPANGYLIIWASSTVARGANHTSFSLSADGERVALVDDDGVTIVDSLSFGPQPMDISYGRLPNGGVGLKYFKPSSPGAANVEANSYNELLAPPAFSHSGGFYNSSFMLSMNHADPSVKIYYTIDGSVPDSTKLTPQSYEYRNEFNDLPGNSLYQTYQSYQYTSSISVTDPSSLPNKISMMASTHSQGLEYLPASPIYKGKIVRAIAVKSGALPSEITSSSFFFSPTGANKFTLPVVSIMSQEDGLFDYYNGIYVPGIDFDTWRLANPTQGPDTDNPANYRRTGEAAERASHFEIIESDTVVYKQDIGLRIHGGWSRGYRFKSLRIYGTDQYKTIENSIFPDLPYSEYKTFILRNSGNDYAGTLFKDAFIHGSVAHLKMDIQAYRPAILFLNGEYWGIHNLRQRQDKHYYAQKYGVDADNLDVIGTEVDEGDTQHYDAMLNYINVNNIANATHYDYIKTQMDVESFIDYEIAEIYYNNWDWGPNNIKLWRLRTPYNPNAAYGHDGRWRWSLYDTDHAMTEPTQNRLSIASTIGTVGSPGFLLGKLLLNETFKYAFINRFADLMNTAFLPAHLTQLVNAKRDGISAEIPAHLDRWKTLASSTQWLTKINDCINFIQQRPNNQRGQIQGKFGISGQYDLTVNVSNPDHGYVKVNTIDILPTTPGVSATPYPWTGRYYNGIPVQLRAYGKTGYKFKHWSYNSTTSTDSVLTVTPGIVYTAVFEVVPLDPCGYRFTEWASTSTPGTSPANMKFVYMADSDPGVSSLIAGYTSGAFNLGGSTRINGLGTRGFSFINTGGENVGYPATKLGGALLILSTTGKDEVRVRWTGRTVKINLRQYAIRLQYRIGDQGSFTDVLNDNNQVVEYIRGSADGDSTVFDVTLPNVLANQPYIQLLWRYYRQSGTSGARDELGIDDIFVETKRVLSGPTAAGASSLQEGMLVSTASVGSTSNVLYEAKRFIELNPGFNTSQGAVFRAQISGCP